MPWIFLGFVDLYTITTIIAFYFFRFLNITNDLSSTLTNYYIIQTYVRTSNLSLLTYNILLAFDPVYKRPFPEVREYFSRSGRIYFLLLILIAPVAIYFNAKYNWTTGSRDTVFDSIAAYCRDWISIIAIYIMLSTQRKYRAVLSLVIVIIIALLSTQRTNLFIIIVGVLLVNRDDRRAFKVFLVSILFLLIIGSIRNGVPPWNIVYSIVGEGIFGSWGMYNAIAFFQNNGYYYRNLLRPLNGYINWLLPFAHLPELSTVLADNGINYYPMGGFFFLSDAYLFNPILGPIIFTVLFHALYKFIFHGIKNAKTEMEKFKYVVYYCLLFEFIKASQQTFIAMLVFFTISMYLVNWVVITIRTSVKTRELSSRNWK